MQKLYVVGASAIALSAALGSGAAFALPPSPHTVSVNIADYNAAQVTTAGAILTVPTGLATYSVNSGTLEINSRFTVTLPAGFSFSSQPALTSTSGTTFALAGGGIGSQSITYTVGGTPLLPGNSATLTSFAIQGATALESPIPAAAALPISMQSTNNSQIDNNDAAPISKPVFASEPGAAAEFVGALQFIDLTAPILGTEFGANPATDSTTVALSAIAIGAETTDAATGSHPVLSADGSLNTLASTDTATVTVSGLFNGISAAFASTTSDCTTPAATGTVAPTQVTIPGVALNREVFFCVTSDGTSLLQQNPNGFFPTVTPGTSTDFLGASVNANPLGTPFYGLWTYSGGGVISVTNFFTGDDSGYSSLLRVNNAGAGTVNLFALVQPDTGGVALTGSLGSLGAGTGTVFTEPQIAAAVTGLDLANSGQRATIQLIISGDFGNVAASSFLVNPSGFVDNVGTQNSEK
ncbi:MAG: hypothetical protein WDN69_04440 [Aliidongia sp.]